MREFGLAVLHNELARCNADLGVVAFRLMMILAEKAHKEQELRVVRFKVSDYIDTLQLPGKSAYAYLDEAILCLMRTIIQTPNAVGGQRRFQVLAPGDTDPVQGEFEVRFNDDMRPLLLNLSAYFAKIPLGVFFRIQGSYSVRFYLFCKSWDPELNKAPGWRMTVQELRLWLGIGKKQYLQTFHLRGAIIERARQELDEVADVSFRYDPVTEGKKVVGWDFIPVRNNPKAQSLPAKRRALRRIEKAAEAKRKSDQDSEAVARDDIGRISSQWLVADLQERQAWLDAMTEGERMFAPKPGARPGRVFLESLKRLLEPELPGLN